ncbi:hypothetical protein EMCRGX_G006776 [Ephydatia muelleri]
MKVPHRVALKTIIDTVMWQGKPGAFQEFTEIIPTGCNDLNRTFSVPQPVPPPSRLRRKAAYHIPEATPTTTLRREGSNYVCPSCFHLLRRRCFAPDGFDAVSVQNVGSTYIIVSWDLPTHSNGILINFSLYSAPYCPPVTPTGTALQLERGVGCHQCCSQPAQHEEDSPPGGPPDPESDTNDIVISLFINKIINLTSPLAPPLPYGGAYSQYPIPQLEQDVGMGHLSSHPLPQTGNPGSITEIECTLLSGSAEQDALTMKESPLKNLILFFLRPHPSWGWLQND